MKRISVVICFIFFSVLTAGKMTFDGFPTGECFFAGIFAGTTMTAVCIFRKGK